MIDRLQIQAFVERVPFDIGEAHEVRGVRHAGCIAPLAAHPIAAFDGARRPGARKVADAQRRDEVPIGPQDLGLCLLAEA